jgi:hypothetical protein
MKSYITDRSEISISFKYPNFKDPLFPKLRSIANLEVANLPEAEKVKKISGYAHSLFSHGNDIPSLLDPIIIIKEVREGKSFRCVEHSYLATSLLFAYGMPARIVGLKTKDAETREICAGHVVVEFWSAEFKKWIMVDVQFGIIPKYEKDFLSAIELGEKLDQNLPVEYVSIARPCFFSGEESKKYTEWIHPYLYFFDTPLDLKLKTTEKKRFSSKRIMLIPIGATPPKVFQKITPINAVYTHSILDFYPQCSKNRF